MYQSKNNPHILQEISTNILTKMSDITGSPHWACSEKCKQKNLVTEKSVSAVWLVMKDESPKPQEVLDCFTGHQEQWHQWHYNASLSGNTTWLIPKYCKFLYEASLSKNSI